MDIFKKVIYMKKRLICLTEYADCSRKTMETISKTGRILNS
jgi:hypothetical protein